MKIYVLASLVIVMNSRAQVVSTLAGNTTAGSADGIGAAAGFNAPFGVCTDGSGNLYVADLLNNEIRKIVISTGVVSTLAGNTTGGSADGIGVAASFNHPYGVALDGLGNLFVADANNNEIRKIVISTGVVSTLAGNTTAGSANGIGAAASFNYPTGVAADGLGNLYVADYNNNEIRKIVISTGVVSTLAGTTTFGSADGIGAAASFHRPYGIAIDGLGNLFVADANNNEIRKIVISSKVVSTMAGNTTVGSANGIGVAASFNYPTGVSVDGLGNLYVADYTNNEIRKIVISTGVVSTVAGNGTIGSNNGTGPAATFYYPSGIAADGLGNLYVAGDNNNEIRKIVIGGAVGIQQFTSINEQVNIYPNPNNGNFTMELADYKDETKLQIANLLGEKIHEQKLNSKVTELNFNLKSGIYLINIIDLKSSYNTKMIIE